MGAQVTRKIIESPPESEEVRQRGLEMARILLDGFPEVANEIRQKAVEEGIEKGAEKGVLALRHTLLAALSARKLRVTVAQKERILTTTDLDTLERWARAALTATTTATVFNDAPLVRSRRTRR